MFCINSLDSGYSPVICLASMMPALFSLPDFIADTATYPIIPSIAKEKIKAIRFFLLKKDEATTITIPIQAAMHIGINGTKIIERKNSIICNAFKLPFNTQTIPPGSITINPIRKFNKYININLLLIISELFKGRDKRVSISRLPNKIPLE